MGWTVLAALATSATINLLPLSKDFRTPLPGLRTVRNAAPSS